MIFIDWLIDELFDLATEKYRESLVLQPSDYRSLSNWGLSLFMQALNRVRERPDDPEAEKLFLNVCINYYFDCLTLIC